MKSRGKRPPGKSGKLTEKERRFVDAYLSGDKVGNGTAAARSAGYKGAANSLAATANRLLRKGKVAAAIAANRSSSTTIADRTRRREFWTEVLSDSKVRMADRLKASELLGKSEGDFLDRLANPDGSPLAAPPMRIVIERRTITGD